MENVKVVVAILGLMLMTGCAPRSNAPDSKTVVDNGSDIQPLEFKVCPNPFPQEYEGDKVSIKQFARPNGQWILVSQVAYSSLKSTPRSELSSADELSLSTDFRNVDPGQWRV